MLILLLLLLSPCLLLYAIASYCTGRLWPPCALLASMPVMESALTLGPQKILMMMHSRTILSSTFMGDSNSPRYPPTSLDTQPPAAGSGCSLLRQATSATQTTEYSAMPPLQLCYPAPLSAVRARLRMQALALPVSTDAGATAGGWRLYGGGSSWRTS